MAMEALERETNRQPVSHFRLPTGDDNIYFQQEMGVPKIKFVLKMGKSSCKLVFPTNGQEPGAIRPKKNQNNCKPAIFALFFNSPSPPVPVHSCARLA